MSIWHSNPNVVDENKLNPMQKHNKRVDKIKNEWALMHGLPLLRIWEEDIRNNKQKVLEELQKYIDIGLKKKEIMENKKKLCEEHGLKMFYLRKNINIDDIIDYINETGSTKSIR